jgi:DNA-binding NarL/FixJ family response regulator/mannose-6-phosphate isomerase-like protein (cupin superfamily)
MILEPRRTSKLVGEASMGSRRSRRAAAHSRRRVDGCAHAELDGIEATRRLLANGATETKVVMLTTFDMDEYVYDALRAGASGFLLKDVPPSSSSKGFARSGTATRCSRRRSRGRLIEEFVRLGARPRGAAAARPRADARELEVLKLIARGPLERRDREGALRQRDDGEDHVAHVLMKLGVRDRVQAVVLAYESGLVQPARLLLEDESEIRRATDGESGVRPTKPTRRCERLLESTTTRPQEGQEMFNAGDQIENPVTGERLVFHETASETGGERVVFETIVQPGGFVAAAHVHPFQTERFEVLEGTLAMRRGKETVELGAGETVVVEPAPPHKFWNAGEGEVRFVCTVTPAVQFERLIATMYSLAAAGKTNRKGMPNPIRSP